MIIRKSLASEFVNAPLPTSVAAKDKRIWKVREPLLT
jgi:hypothetical protein